jgi:hypothetical protein
MLLHEWRLSTVDWLSGWWSRDNGGDICWWWSDVEADSDKVVERESVGWLLLSNLYKRIYFRTKKYFFTFKMWC